MPTVRRRVPARPLATDGSEWTATPTAAIEARAAANDADEVTQLRAWARPRYAAHAAPPMELVTPVFPPAVPAPRRPGFSVPPSARPHATTLAPCTMGSMISVMAEVQELDARLRARRFHAAKVSVALAAAAMFVFVVAAAVSSSAQSGASAATGSTAVSPDAVESAARFADAALHQAEALEPKAAQPATLEAERPRREKSKARKGRKASPGALESASSGSKSRADREERRAQKDLARDGAVRAAESTHRSDTDGEPSDKSSTRRDVRSAAAAPRPGTDHAMLVAVAVGGTCTFTIDGVGHGVSSHARVSVATGTHSVTCRPALGGASRTRSITLAAGEVKSTVFKL